jgi:hypothetical protein
VIDVDDYGPIRTEYSKCAGLANVRKCTEEVAADGG